MQAVDAILFDPVGALAEFPAAPFQTVAARVFARSPAVEAQGSQAYWDMLDLLASCDRPLRQDEHRRIDAGELEAVDAALVYDDAGPALAELAGPGVRLIRHSAP